MTATAGELRERFASLLLVEGDHVLAEVPTYRGEGHAFAHGRAYGGAS